MIILILGGLGKGKSSLACNFVIKGMDSGQEQLDIAADIIECKFPGFSNIALPDNHLVYTDMGVHGSEISISDNRPYVTNGFRVGLKNNDFETDYFPYGSLLVFDEARKYWDSRKSMLSYEKGGTHPKTLEFFELSRQNGLNIILVSQLENHLDNRIVNLAQLVICPYKFSVEKVGKKVKRLKSLWHCLLFDSLDDYKKHKENPDSVKPREHIFEFNGCIFDHYDSEYFQFRFLSGLEEYSNKLFEECDGSREEVERLNERFDDQRHKPKKSRDAYGEFIGE